MSDTGPVFAGGTDPSPVDEPRSAASVFKRLDPRQFGLPIAVVALGIFFALRSPVFLQSSNFQNVGRQAAGLAAVSFGQTFVILAAGLDLSVGATVGLVSVATALGVVNFGIAAGLAIGLATGVLVGLVNGLVTARLGVVPFVTTLATLSIASGVALMLSGGIPVTGLPPSMTEFARQTWVGIPATLVVAIVLWLVAFVVLRWSRFGRYIYAVGGNPEASRLAGIPVAKVVIGTFVMASTFSAVGAILLTARVNSGQPNLGGDLALQSIAAVVIGGVSLFGGRGSIVGVGFGVVFISLLANGLNLLDVPSYTQMVIIGAALITAVVLDNLIARRSGESR